MMSKQCIKAFKELVPAGFHNFLKSKLYDVLSPFAWESLDGLSKATQELAMELDCGLLTTAQRLFCPFCALVVV